MNVTQHSHASDDRSDVNIRPARPEEAEHLSELALRSKGHWGYSAEFLESCRDELRVDADRLGSNDYPCFVAETNDGVLGYYTLEREDASTVELGALFIEPVQIGKGVGRQLMQHAIATASSIGAERLVIQGDPNAESFYQAAGAVKTGTRESGSIPGRHLPLFEIRLADNVGNKS
ncbi:MAG: GNAT family N-acetyltransferase [Pseudomonadota bacterium]